MKSRVLERFSSKDIYDLSEVDKTAHLDHIVELQIFVYVLRRLQDDEDWEMARQLCYIVANNIANLGLTSANINRIKGQAVRRKRMAVVRNSTEKLPSA
ncbi:hypothetical protein PHYBOEH_001231 [Phytophthora boehmeriae]|uniref:Uncharacterized protein n=1 Tax=Phytophthora boehmeriae TaxID=109152 RepID=A0A8T1WSS3_9STRA|nr:hypothetical protein PHYBOEH_001231 [Phytophthora boehmeriae]